MKNLMRAVIMISILSFPLLGIAEAQSGKVVTIGNGTNYVDFTGNGKPGLVVMGHRDNFNAHSFDVVSFYLFSDPKDGSLPVWNIIPVMKKEKEQLEVIVSGGADCILHDFRLLSDSGMTPAALILADRELGSSYADLESVTFTYFYLEKNSEGIPGSPLFSFKQSRVVKSKAKYCDVGEAYQKELGIGTYKP
ncbi:MAG TPA: hypothetical protein VLX29_03050 [Nitrospirota bacterium]|nr:hypothetical protein [Nitrospirota bacterium]